MKTRTLGDTPVYFISIKPSPARIVHLDAQREANDVVPRRAEERDDLVYIDVAHAMMVDGGLRDIYLTDGVHMNAQGYRIWSGIVGEMLAESAPTRAPGC